MKTFYILRNTDKLQSSVNATQVFENLEDLKIKLGILTTTHPYWTIYKIERETLPQGQMVDIHPIEDQAAILHVFQLGWEIFFQPIDQFPMERRASLVNSPQQPNIDDNQNVLYKQLRLKPRTVTADQKTYIATLQNFLKPSFFKKNEVEQWQELFALRLQNRSFLFLYEYRELSRTLLENMARAAGKEAQIELSKSTTLAPLFQGSAPRVPVLVVSQPVLPKSNTDPVNCNNDLKF